jgi:hypothetical protein
MNSLTIDNMVLKTYQSEFTTQFSKPLKLMAIHYIIALEGIFRSRS